jgi:dCMP deaminase
METQCPQAPLSWDEYFILQAMIASFRSKDPSTKVGSVFVDQHNHQISMGYNGFIAGIDETKIPWTKEGSLEESKYGYVVHAEANAILHTTKNLEGSRCYVTLFPCNECAKLIASKKVSEVIFLSDKHQEKEHTRVAKKIFDLTGIKYRKIDVTDKLLKKLEDHLINLIHDA